MWTVNHKWPVRLIMIHDTVTPSRGHLTALQMRVKPRFYHVCPTQLPYTLPYGHRRSAMAACVKGLDKFMFSLRLLRNHQLQNERSILAVTMGDPNASGKSNRFVGICIQRGGKGLGASFVLRNIIDNQGVEICYELYSPRIQQIEVLKLEKRLDDNLMYLRDAMSEYSTVDPNMKPVPLSPTGEVPVNQLRVRMRPKPWSKRWERPKFNIKGICFELALTPEQMEHAQKWEQPWNEYDMLKEYDTSTLEEKVLSEVQREMSK
uniref:Large ribosomal subunit protein bL19m n=1 Tax=Labrus bergylta TaxID=56723 RepID=A0A3Q3FZI5_9LABR